MCEPAKAVFPLGTIAAGVAAAVVAVHVAPALPAFLTAALVAVYGACVVGGVVLWRLLRQPQSRARIYKPPRVAARQALPARPRELPAAVRAIGAPKLIVVTPADVVATPTPRPPAERTTGRG